MKRIPCPQTGDHPVITTVAEPAHTRGLQGPFALKTRWSRLRHNTASRHIRQIDPMALRTGGGRGEDALVRIPPTLFLTVGLPGAGKTVRARELARKLSILRLTPDEWMAPLFGDSDAGGRRDILEGRLIWVAHEVLVSGVSVILDFGCWSPDERYAIRVIAGLAHATFALLYVEVTEAVRRARCDKRWSESPETTFAMSAADHDRFLLECRPSTADELAYGPVPEPPSGCQTWAQWASRRWPTLPALDP